MNGVKQVNKKAKKKKYEAKLIKKKRKEQKMKWDMK